MAEPASEAPPAAGIAPRFRVQIVDDHDLMRAGLMALSRASGRLPVAWLEAANLGDALDAHRGGASIDLVLLDLNLPDSQGLQGLRRFLTEVPTVPVAVFSGTQDEFVVRQALGMGAVAFLPKSSSAEGSLRLVESLLETGAAAVAATAGAAGESEQRGEGSERGPGPSVVGPALNGRLRALPPQLRAGADTLTATQLKVLELMLEGLSNQQIAGECGLALGTVKNATSCIYLAMDVRSRAHLMSVFR